MEFGFEYIIPEQILDLGNAEIKRFMKHHEIRYIDELIDKYYGEYAKKEILNFFMSIKKN